MSKITVIIDHSGSTNMAPQKMTLELGQDAVLSEVLEFFEIVLHCMTFSVNGKLEIVQDEDE